MADNGDDEFPDGFLDDLPESTLRDLLANADRSTQQTRGAVTQVEANAKAIGNGPFERRLHVNRPLVEVIGPPSSDHEFEEETVIDLDNHATTYGVPREFGEAPGLQNWMQGDHNDIASLQGLDAGYGQGDGFTGFPQGAEAYGESLQPANGDQPVPYETAAGPADSHAAADELYARLDQLERERERLAAEHHNLQKQLEQAKHRATSQAGEIAIVRNNLTKAKKENEQKTALMQQKHAEETAKLKAELERLRVDNAKVQDSNLFLQHDLVREAQKSRRVRKTVNDGDGGRSGTAQASPMTPKKQKGLPFRDGFEDDDMVMVSPTKPKSKAGTPKGGKKRKRAAVDHSPVRPLEFDEPIGSPTPLEAQETALVNPPFNSALLALYAKGDARYEFLQRLLNYRLGERHGRLFEELTLYNCPFAPKTSLSSFILDELFDASLDETEEDLPLRFCHILIDIWEHCCSEVYLEPVYIIVEALQYTLALEPISAAYGLVEKVLGLTQPLLDSVAMPLVRAQQKIIPLAERDTHKLILLRKHVKMDQCLSLLLDIALSASNDTTAITTFWQNTQPNFILLMLNKAIPIECISLMIRILNTSVLPTTFGHILPSTAKPDEQHTHEEALLSRLTNLLSEHPDRAPEDPQHDIPYPAAAILALRIQVLQLLNLISRTDAGRTALARHRDAIAKLIRFLHRTVTALYDHAYPTQRPLCTAVNLCVRVLHRLLTGVVVVVVPPAGTTTTTASADPPAVVDVKEKLRGLAGTAHMYMVALTRVAFSDGFVLDAAVEEEVAQMAQELVEMKLTPEEADGIMDVYRVPM